MSSAQPVDLASLPDDAVIYNDEHIEQRWAEDAYKYAETYERLLKAVTNGNIEKLRKFRFTGQDDAMYAVFRERFPNLNVKYIDVDALKSTKSKQEWFGVLESFKDKLKDYNRGTLLRIDSSKNFGPTNSCVVPRSQFYCIELARCREGFNDSFVASAPNIPINGSGAKQN